MVVHHVTKEVPGYALVLGKGGSKLKPSAADDKPMMGGRRQAEPNGQAVQTITARKMEVRDLTFLLVMTTNRPVIDRTGCDGLERPVSVHGDSQATRPSIGYDEGSAGWSGHRSIERPSAN
jgi:hypothetical protein